MKYIILIFILFSIEAKSDCEKIFLDRFDLAEKQFADMDLSDEYTTDISQTLKHPIIYNKLKKINSKLKFSKYKKENEIIRKDLDTKLTNQTLKISYINNLKNQSRKGYLIKEDINNVNYYSFIIYTDLSCNPFNSKVHKNIVKSKKNEKKLPNKK